MYISKIEVIRLSIPYQDGSRPPEGISQQAEHVLTGFSTQKAMESLLLKVTTNTGVVGWGEAFGHLANPATFTALTETVARYFIGAFIDQSELLSASSRVEQALKAFHLYGRTGPILYAISGIEIALWDIKAQIRELPLYRLLGGDKGSNQPLQVYASLVSYREDAAVAIANALDAVAKGFRCIKLHELEFDTIQAVRQALPEEVSLMTDVNCAWALTEAIGRARQLSSLNLGWLEEPIWPPDDVEALAVLRAEGVPLSAGENASGIEGYAHYLKVGALDVIQPSIAKIGGVSAMLEAYTLGKRYSTKVQPHCYYYGAGLLATAHVIAGMGGTEMVEVPWVSFEAHLIPQMAFEPSFTLLEVPGLGFSPDAAILQNYSIAHATIE